MTLLLAVRGNIATRSMSGPPFVLQLRRSTVWCRATDHDDTWLKAHIDEIIATYPHKALAILDQRIVAVGDSLEEVHRLVTAHYPGRVPLLFEVPNPEEFVCLLCSTRTW